MFLEQNLRVSAAYIVEKRIVVRTDRRLNDSKAVLGFLGYLLQSCVGVVYSATFQKQIRLRFGREKRCREKEWLKPAWTSGISRKGKIERSKET